MLRLKLETISGTKFDEDVHEVQLPTTTGTIGVFTNHMPLISVASHGVIKVRKKPADPDDFMELFATNGGVIEVSENVVLVLVDEADHEADIDESEAQKAHERALKMKAEANDQVSLEHAQSMIDRQAVRLQVAGLKRRKRRR